MKVSEHESAVTMIRNRPYTMLVSAVRLTTYQNDTKALLAAYDAAMVELLAARRVVEWLRSEVSRARVERETGRCVAGFSGPLLPPGLVTKASKTLDAYDSFCSEQSHEEATGE